MLGVCTQQLCPGVRGGAQGGSRGAVEIRNAVEIGNAVQIGNAGVKGAAIIAVKLHQVTFSTAWQRMIDTSLVLVLLPGCLVSSPLTLLFCSGLPVNREVLGQGFVVGGGGGPGGEG